MSASLHAVRKMSARHDRVRGSRTPSVVFSSSKQTSSIRLRRRASSHTRRLLFFEGPPTGYSTSDPKRAVVGVQRPSSQRSLGPLLQLTGFVFRSKSPAFRRSTFHALLSSFSRSFSFCSSVISIVFLLKSTGSFEGHEGLVHTRSPVCAPEYLSFSIRSPHASQYMSFP